MSSSTPTRTDGGRPNPKIEGISFGTLFRGIRHYSLVMFVAVLLAAGVGTAVYLFIPIPKMTGQVLFRIKEAPESVLTPTADNKANFNSYRQFQMAAIRSKTNVNATVSDPTVTVLAMLNPPQTSDPVNFLTGSMRVDFNYGPELMRLVLEGDNAEELTTILKSHAKNYINDLNQKDKAVKVQRMERLLKLQQEYTGKIRSNNASIQSAMLTLGGSGDPYAATVRERMMDMQISTLQTSYDRLISDMRNSNVDKSLAFPNGAVTAASITVPDKLLEDLMKSHPRYMQPKYRLEAMAADLERKQKDYKGETPGMKQLKADMALLEAELKTLPAKLKPEIEAKVKEYTVQTQEQKIEDYKSKTVAFEAFKKEIDKDLEELFVKKKGLVVNQGSLDAIRSEVAMTEMISMRITGEIELMKPELDTPTRVSIWEDPSTFPGVESNKRTKYTMMSVGGIVGLALVLITWLEYRNRRVQTAGELSNGLGLRVFGNLPIIPRGGNRSSEKNSYWQHMLTESIDTTRTMLLSEHPREADATRTLLVSSALSGEGKTSLCTHLAVSMARAGFRVLLIDADMRRPAVHKVLEIENSPGLSDVLTGGFALSDVITTCRVPGLQIVPAGKWKPEAAANLSGEPWRLLQAELDNHYDYVLIDSPPILPVADALALARKVDGVLLAVMKDVSRISAIDTARQRLHLVGANVVGVVFAGADVNSYYGDRNYVYANPTGNL